MLGELYVLRHIDFRGASGYCEQFADEGPNEGSYGNVRGGPFILEYKPGESKPLGSTKVIGLPKTYA
jgi:hypothetical protein